MLGPPDSEWQDGWFLLSVYFPANYDQSPPRIVFKTIPFHPNVNAETGEVCMDVLNPTVASTSFSPRVCLQTILVMLQAQLGSPVLDNPVNADAAHVYQHSPKTYQKVSASSMLNFLSMIE
jgi:ubiquitin-conjugating enzyme E2 U